MKANIVIFLTSAIDVNGITYSKVNDMEERYNEYRSSLMCWVEEPAVDKIVFCDNSNFNLSEIQKDVKEKGFEDKLELLSYDGQNFNRNLGKGYGEITTFQYAFDHSIFIKQADIILKVNGRYFLENISSIIESLYTLQDAMVLGDFRKKLTWMDSRVFAFKLSFLEKYFLFYRSQIDDSKGFKFEMALARSAHQAMAEGHHWEMLPVVPVIKGRSGSTGRVYSVYGIRYIIKMIYLKIVRYLLAR